MLPLFSGCIKEETPIDNKVYPEYIVFGQYIDMSNCFGSQSQCVNIFKIDATGVYDDVNSVYPINTQPINGAFSLKKSSNAAINIETLFKDNPIPSELLDHDSGTIGEAPVWANNFYLEVKTSKGYQHWILDGQFNGSLPGSIQNYLNIISLAVNIATSG